jgi:hypothetical protein
VVSGGSTRVIPSGITRGDDPSSPALSAHSAVVEIAQWLHSVRFSDADVRMGDFVDSNVVHVMHGTEVAAFATGL